jgi:hypothetical protein
MSIKIESDVPLPPATGGAKKYPFDEMAIGQSFFIRTDELPKSGDKAVRSSATQAAKRLRMKFTMRQVKNGVRLWRTE